MQDSGSQGKSFFLSVFNISQISKLCEAGCVRNGSHKVRNGGMALGFSSVNASSTICPSIDELCISIIKDSRSSGNRLRDVINKDH